MLEHLISLIAPHECLTCHTEGAVICTACSRLLPQMPLACYRCKAPADSSHICADCRPTTPLHAVSAATTYQDVQKELVGRLKYHYAVATADPMARLMAERIVPPQQLVVTHIPTATSRVRQRGYDQAALLARRFAGLCGLPYVPLLGRMGQHRQVGKGRAARQEQVRDALWVHQQRIPQKARVLLVDDVITTGSTVEAAASALRQAGVEHIEAVAFAVA